MLCSFNPTNPTIRLKVFISSAQRDENGFRWSEVRRKVKEQLEECPYIVPFIIDTVASEISSTQLFQYEVLKADVVVMLLKGEVRPGTSVEFATATKYNKPLLVYFLKDEKPSLEVIRLRKAVQAADYCTYRDIDTFDNIAEIVRSDVITNVIRYYQYDHFAKSEIDTAPVEVSTVTAESTLLAKHSTPTKASIALFSSSYTHIYHLLGIYDEEDKNVPETPMHKLGIAALDWLVTGTPLKNDTEVLNLIEALKELYDSTDWIIKRWDVIRFALSGNFEKAFKAGKEALALAKMRNLPTWIINDILIDCRNIENEIFNNERKWGAEGEAQKELNKLDTIVYFPVLDRYLANIYDSIAKEQFKRQTASPNTILMGTNLEEAINNVENYFFSAILYGSYTHMIITRDILARVLYQYDEIAYMGPLLFDSIRLAVLQGDTNRFAKTLDYKWDNIYTEIASHADMIWDLTNFVTSSHKESMKQTIITKIGLYLSDAKFEEAQRFLENLASTIYWGNSEDYFECLCQNMCRLNCSTVMRMLSGIIKEQRFHLGRKLSNIILQMKLDSVEIECQHEFCDILKDKLSFIIKNGGCPQIIAALANQNPEVFSVLSTIPGNGLTGVEKLLYDINMGKGNWNEVLLREIETARKQFEVNKYPGEYTYFSELPYAMIKMVVREHYISPMNKTIEQRFFPLCIEVLSSQATAKVKKDCLDCLSDILAFNTELNAIVPQGLSDIIAKIEVKKERTALDESIGDFNCRALMVKIIFGVADKEELLEQCVGYSKKDVYERIALAECIEQFMVKLPYDQIDATVLSVIMNCFEDEYYAVRWRACSCLALLLDTKYEHLAKQKLCEAAIDPSHYVRSKVLNLCRDNKIRKPEFRDELLGILVGDANYAIRIGCQ